MPSRAPTSSGGPATPRCSGPSALWGRIVEHEHGFRATLAYPQRLRLLCYLCFTLWGRSAPGDCEVVVRHRGGRMVPLCEPHLELSRRYGYRVPRILSARAIESELLATYAVDPLRELARANGGTAESIPASTSRIGSYRCPRPLLRWLELDDVCATGAFELRDPRLEPLPFGDVADPSVVAGSVGRAWP